MASYTTKLGLIIGLIKGDLQGAWHDTWNQDNTRLEDRLTKSYAGNPNTNVAGDYVGQSCWDSTNKRMYYCTTTGVAASAVWETPQYDWYALAPSGTLLLWDKPEAQIPSGWAKVTGVDGKYIIFTSSDANIGTIVGNNTVTPTMQTAGAHDHGGVSGSTVLTENQIPAHDHDVVIGLYGTSPSGTAQVALGGLPFNSNKTISSEDAGGGQGHTHTIASQSGHQHTMDAVDNRPSSVTYMLIKKA